MPPQARQTVERIVEAVEAGDDRRIRALLTELAEVADTAALLYLRKRLLEGRED
ncbi:hypothetical protein [Streptomyces sp. H27-S2]|uniref:hypothetical protein n=1 Tax=Streptomyces antarcticus TaxID=2996458 RepID=UPI00226DC8D3|nr:hypothetical protein [Streptomyces sp. H27-S2]MCY0949087.1 hypothetical protein [Streptomyces sp. H27-S2]